MEQSYAMNYPTSYANFMWPKDIHRLKCLLIILLPRTKVHYIYMHQIFFA